MSNGDFISILDYCFVFLNFIIMEKAHTDLTFFDLLCNTIKKTHLRENNAVAISRLFFIIGYLKIERI